MVLRAHDRRLLLAGWRRRRSRSHARSRSYGAKQQPTAPRIGDPGNAPACNRNVADAAVIRPSLVAPILTVLDDPEVGPPAWNSSWRDMMIFTGRPDLRDSTRATGSRYTTVLPPKPPPISAGMARTALCGKPLKCALIARTMKWPWLLLQMVALPSWVTLTRQECGSM